MSSKDNKELLRLTTKGIIKMNTDRIEEIQKNTAYCDSVSVQQALLQVWNECEQAAGGLSDEEVWIRFATSYRGNGSSELVVAGYADKMLSEFRKRFRGGNK